MRVRALQNCQINTPQGPRYVHGPQLDSEDRQLAEGEVLDVPDDMIVNPDVLEVLVPPRSGQVRYVQPRRPPA